MCLLHVCWFGLVRYIPACWSPPHLLPHTSVLPISLTAVLALVNPVVQLVALVHHSSRVLGTILGLCYCLNRFHMFSPFSHGVSFGHFRVILGVNMCVKAALWWTDAPSRGVGVKGISPAMHLVLLKNAEHWGGINKLNEDCIKAEFILNPRFNDWQVICHVL